MLTIGTFLNDRYEILEKIGSGGMSDVYRAKCHMLNRFVAVKVLKQEYSEDKNFVSKFRVEAQSAAGLSHPNIVNIYDVGEDEGLYYIVMELVEGITLKSYIDKKARLDVKEAVSIAIQVAQGIQTAHTHHIIHRDIKPQNIIISKEGKVKVTDFGIARASSSQTISSNAMGSVHYISPEQARGNYSDERSDIYSLGITLYEMVTGMVPFEGDTAVAVALQHIQGEIPSPRDYVKDLPISVEKIIYKCTQKKSERRYAKASELIADLKKSLISPNDDFVQLIPLHNSAPTVSLSTKEVSVINTAEPIEPKNKTRGGFNPDYIIDDDGGSDTERVNPKVERVMTILSVVAAILIVSLLVFIIVKMLPKTKNNSKDPTTVETVTSVPSSQNNNSTTAADNEPNKAIMPNIMGMTEEDALVALNQVNLGMNPTYEVSDTVEKGRVISQEYPEGTKVNKNTSVRVVISSGPELFEVPSVVGLKEDLAIDTLNTYNLKPSSEYMYNDEVEQGYVISMTPSAPAMVSKGDSVTIIVSMGSEFKEVVMPDVRNKSLDDAKLEIEAKGLIVGDIEEAFSSEVEQGKVISQSVESGGNIKQGSTVNLVISKGPEEPETPKGTIGTVTISRAQINEYLSADGGSFVVPVQPGPGAPELTYYTSAILRMELVQTTEDGRTISKNLDTIEVRPDSFPFTKGGIIGEPGIMEGTIKVYLTIGGVEYSCGNCLVDFQ